jgi:GNAT superfamily N-acetyltransferase
MLKIRTGSIDDCGFIASSQVAMALETEDYKLDADTVFQGVKSVLEDKSKGVYYLAEREGQSVGCLLTVPEWSDWRCKTCLWIHSVYILPEFRNQGVYKEMYNHLKQFVKSSEDYFGLRLYVEKTNEKAQSVYEKLGMTQEHYSLYEWLE